MLLRSATYGSFWACLNLPSQSLPLPFIRLSVALSRCTHTRTHALLACALCTALTLSFTLSLSLCRRAVAVDQLCVCLSGPRSIPFCAASRLQPLLLFVCFFLRFLCIFTARCYQNAARCPRRRRSHSHSRRAGVFHPLQSLVATPSSQ